MRGADALIAALERAGVDTVFGMPGGASLPLYDALLDTPIRHVLMRHEAGAGHAAEGYARATGRVGVAFATSGPGATNLVTPICDAHMDSIPTLFVTGQVRTALRGTNAFQEADVIGITAPIVKHSLAVERPDDIAQAVADALHLATRRAAGAGAARRAVDIAAAPARDVVPHAPQLPGYRPRTKPNGRQMRIAAQAIAAARRPVLYAGGGVVHAGAAAELTRSRGSPAAGHDDADGARRVPGERPQWLGMLGMHGTVRGQLGDGRGGPDRRRRRALRRPRDRRARRVRAAGEDRAHRRRPGGDRQERRRARADRRRRPPALAGDRRRLRRRRRRGSRAGGSASTAGAPTPAAAHRRRGGARRAQDTIGGDAIVTTDVGQHQMWAANRLRFDRPRRWITSGGLGTMGFGLPAAIGAQIAHPDETVVCVTGEGSLLMNVQELATAAARAPAGQGRRARQPLARHGPPAAGHVLGRPPQRGRPRRDARLARPRARVRDRGARRSDDSRRDRRTLADPGPALVRIRSIRRPIACRCSAPAGLRGR